VSWDIILLRFRDHDVVPFDADEARRIVLSTPAVREAAPYVAEIAHEGIADVYFDAKSPEIMLSVYANSPAVSDLIYRLARELEMVVFFPRRDGWGAAVVEEIADVELPDRSWDGWQDFDDDFQPPEPIVCRNAADLATALAGPYGDWADWAHKPHGQLR
jgi:hypothetical protein